MTAQPPLLRVQDLTTIFKLPTGIVRAVDHVSLELWRGETLGLVGESGSGKSMTALSILRLVQPPGETLGGPIEFNGRHDLLELSEHEMRRIRGAEIGFIFQEPMTALNPVLTVGHQIAEALLVHGRARRSEARDKAIELLKAVRIPDPARRVRDYPHQLSGGMRQRVLIAMALACQPLLLIADEPTTALDATIQAEILDLLQEMKEKFDLALLLITHDLGVVAGHADRLAVMYAGRIVEDGPVRKVFQSPAHPYTRGLMASIPGGSPGQRLVAIEGAVPNLTNLPPGCAFEPRCPDRFGLCPTAPPPAFQIDTDRSARCYLHDPMASPPASAKATARPPKLREGGKSGTTGANPLAGLKADTTGADSLAGPGDKPDGAR
jgi:oligopeptide/dipeptide ABC transporter ATP-binding protein